MLLLKSVHVLRKEGRLPGEDTVAVVADSDDDEVSTPNKKGCKRKGKSVMVVEGSADKNPKTEDAAKEVDVYTCGHVAAGEKPNGRCCKIHRIASHTTAGCC